MPSLPLLPARAGRLALIAGAAVLSLAACAPVQPSLPHVGRAQIELPPGDWEVLQRSSLVLDVLPDDTAADLPMETTVMGLRGPGKDRPLLALVFMQTNATNYPRDTTLWTAPCPQQDGVFVQDRTRGSPARVDCLRYRRRADTGDYLARSRPVVSQWMAEKHMAPGTPYAHVLYRYATAGGALISLDVVVSQALLRPATRSNDEFMEAGRPAFLWSEKLAQAARQSVSMMDGRLVFPPFPIPIAP
ncbi:hypothetical protein M5C99_21775 [Acidovorax sp. NCPPB 2350]|nr:hypothetical protein M5C99_21775 [Acidovorax sp. NCPPB 2350]